MYNVMFSGSETTGSVAKINPKRYPKNIVQPQAPQCDTVSFKGYEKEESSIASSILKIAALTAVAVGGLGYAHKANLVGKLSDGKVKDILKKTDVITKPCHTACSKVKNFCMTCYDKIKNMFK